MQRIAWILVASALVACSGADGGGEPISPDDAAPDGATDASSEDSVASSDTTSPDDSATSPSDTSSEETTSPTDSASPPTDTAPPLMPICLGKAAGAYCGNDEMKDADASTLYQCPGAGKAPTSSTKCDAGCQVEMAGTADHCKTVVAPDGYRLPWTAGTTMQLTQDCNDSCCSDHVGVDQWAWDFANGGAFTVVAARGGTITHLKINSTTGCGTSSCANDANFIVIDHGDGTESVYLHLAGGSLKAGISCGAKVTSGQALATSGTTGWSTGIHLHFQVGKVHTGAATCECGAGGTGCSATTVPWASFWPTSTYPTVPISFAEWPAASSCANRRITMPAAM
ncbi:MAG: peptidoglycan DD-metalloendopeptidase family protein [Polyangiales bacterium]